MVSKKQKLRNRTIAWILGLITSYVLLVNNSIEFLKNFGIDAEANIIGVIMIFITLGFIGWKVGAGEL